MAFPRLQELAVAQNSNSLTDAMSVYIERKINEDLHFAAGLSHLWEIWMIPVRSLFESDFVSLVKKYAMDRSFTLSSTEEADNVKILQSCNGLLLCDDFGSREFTIYEMTIGCSVWMVRYRVHTDDFMTPLPEGWSIRSNVWSIVLGEREQDSFLVIKLSGKVVQYNLISKTLHEIYDCGSNQVDDNHDDNDDADDDDELLQQFQAEHNVYEFIPSFASV
ncbi:hypothetical protein Tco_0690469 [Tanacetum coccineum]